LKSLDEAYKLLAAKGVDASRVTVDRVNKLDQNQKAVANEVISQDPGPYDNLQPGDKVTLQVATGKIVLPAVKGMSEDDARAKINGAGFNNISTTTTTGPDKGKDGTVVDVDPTANGTIAYDPDQQVTLTIYQYKAPAPTCTSVTNTPSGGTSSSPAPSGSVPASSASTSASSSTGLPPC